MLFLSNRKVLGVREKFSSAYITLLSGNVEKRWEKRDLFLFY